jgi:MFS transporter, Spinster family, sphingosine-1-phosphate transporter
MIPPVPASGRRYAWYVLGVMFAINFLNYLDRYILPAAASSIQKEFSLSDSQVGALASAFLLVYSLMILPFGFWSDRGVRKNVIGTCVAIWSVATLFTGLARSYVQLLVTRGLLGVGEAGYFPAGTALMADWFEKDRRSRISALWSAGTVFGIAAGYIGGGIVAQRYGWRWAFYGTAVPGLICAVLAFGMREPLRGAAEALGPKLDAHHANDADLRNFVGLLRIRSFRASTISQIIMFSVLAVLATYLPLYIQRRYGLSVSASASIGGGVIIAGGLIGTLAGGWLGDWRARSHPAAYLQIPAIAMVVGAVLLFAAMQAPTLTVFIPLALVTAVALYVYNGPFTALAQNVVVPTLRASAVTLSLFLGHLLGDSWSPYAVGVASDALHRNLGLAMSLFGPPLLVVAALVALTGGHAAGGDIDAMEERWASHDAAA